jgi:transposase
MVTCAFVVAPYNLLKRFSKKRLSKREWSRKKKRLRARCRPALPYLG